MGGGLSVTMGYCIALNDEYHGMISDESMKIYQVINWLSELPPEQPEQFNPCTVCQEFDCTGCKFRRT